MLTIDLTSGAAADALPNEDLAMLDLPEGATLQEDGSVLLALNYPAKVRDRTVEGAVVMREVDHLVLTRLSGADVLAMMAAKNTSDRVAIGRSLRMNAADVALMQDRMDAADVMAIQDVMRSLLGLGDGLPGGAEETETGVRLTLRRPMTRDGAQALEFRRLTGRDLSTIGRSKDQTLTGIAVATGIGAGEIRGVIEDMDGADVMAATRVVGFLCRRGRRTGR